MRGHAFQPTPLVTFAESEQSLNLAGNHQRLLLDGLRGRDSAVTAPLIQLVLCFLSSLTGHVTKAKRGPDALVVHSGLSLPPAPPFDDEEVLRTSGGGPLPSALRPPACLKSVLRSTLEKATIVSVLRKFCVRCRIVQCGKKDRSC